MEYTKVDFLLSEDNNKSIVFFTDPEINMGSSELKKLIQRRFSPQGHLASLEKKPGEIAIIEKSGGSKVYACIVQKHNVMKARIENYDACIRLVKADADASGITDFMTCEKFPLGPSTDDVMELFGSIFPLANVSFYIP